MKTNDAVRAAILGAVIGIGLALAQSATAD